MATYIRKGYGFDVQQDFARAWEDLPIEIAHNEPALPGHVIGYIAGKSDSPLGFLRVDPVRVHVKLSSLCSDYPGAHPADKCT